MKQLFAILLFCFYTVSSYAFHFLPGVDDNDEEIEGDFFIPIYLGDAAKDAIIHLIIYLAIAGVSYWISTKIEDIENNFLVIVGFILEIIAVIAMFIVIYYALKIWWIVLIVIVLIAIIGGIYSWIKGDFK